MFKEGQRVKIKRDCSGTRAGEIYTLTYGSKNKDQMTTLTAWKDGLMDSSGSGCSCTSNWELVLSAKELNELNKE